MYDCLIAFGSNQGNSKTILAKTIDALQRDGIAVIATSEPRRTKPVGGPKDQEDYLNAVFRIETNFHPHELHRVLIEIEQNLGRVRHQRWGARKIDLDLILFADQQVATEDLTIPHPRMSFRRFVLEPAVEIAPSMVDPVSGCTIEELLAILDSSHKKMLVVCLSKVTVELARKVKIRLPSEWQIEIVEDIKQFRQHEPKSTLIARFSFADDTILDNESKEVHRAAVTFAGPTLELPLDADKALLELLAAIEAVGK